MATLFFSVGCSDKNGGAKSPIISIQGSTMGTTFSVKAVLDGDTPITEAYLSKEVNITLKAFNQSLSTYILDSELSILNNAPVGEWIELSDVLLNVLDMSGKVYRESSGAFDVTIGPLVNRWGFGPLDVTDLPSQEEVTRLLDEMGFESLEISGNKLRKQKAVYIDLSAIAKGHATDVVANRLGSLGFKNYMVEIGGELKIKGVNGNGKTWTIGVEKPTLGRSGAVQAVSGNDIAIATSGDYRNYLEQDGKRISHTIDPKTGRPIEHKLASVTVITKLGGLADAYATAINVLGPEKGMVMAEQLSLAAYFLVREDDGFRVDMTEEFKRYMVDL
ncbi:MAG: FAD:protein FMN transferase [Agarilytica sp.]